MSDASSASSGAPPDNGDAAEAPEKKTCSCGFDKDHYMVSPEGTYSVGGWISHTVGISTRPKVVRYRCRICREVIEETTDPAVLGKGIR